jgi:DNA-binding beta-propeller fold protein YncE
VAPIARSVTSASSCAHGNHSLIAHRIGPDRVNTSRGTTPAHRINATSRTLGGAPLGVAIDPSAGHLYVADSGSGSVSGFSIGAGGVLTPIACVPATSCQTEAGPVGITVDPSGSYVYVTNLATASVSVFSIGAGGALSPVACDPTTICKTGTVPWGLAVDPSGSHVYVINRSTASLSVFAIGAGGVLSPVACDPTTICKTGATPTGVAVDPNGRYLYVTDEGSTSVSVFSIGAGGVLSPVACDPTTICKTGTSPQGIAIDPSGHHVYVLDGSNSVSVFSIGAGGVLSPVACDPTTICKTGTDPDIFSLAVSPDRGPVAAFSAGAGPAGSVSLLDGSASSSPDYAIASYLREFGDGQTLTSALPAVQHVYAKPGSYTVTLTVTDQAGCALSIVYTGQTASCNGSAKARATQTITVPPAPVIMPPVAAVGKENISPSVFSAKPGGPSALAAKKRKRTYGAKVTYTLNVAASVRFTVQRRSDGRKVKHAKKTTCDRPTKHNRKKQKCTRYVTLKGSFTRAGLTGTNTFRFTGRLNGKRLPPGKYRLIATPTANTKTGLAATANFRIIP